MCLATLLDAGTKAMDKTRQGPCSVTPTTSGPHKSKNLNMQSIMDMLCPSWNIPRNHCGVNTEEWQSTFHLTTGIPPSAITSLRWGRPVAPFLQGMVGIGKYLSFSPDIGHGP